MMAMSLADELVDELDAHLAGDTGDTLEASLGQSLADELDLERDLVTPAKTNPLSDDLQHDTESPSKLREDGLPRTRPRSGSTPRRPKTSNTSTYYTATTSPGRFSSLDSMDEVERDLLEIESDHDDGQTPNSSVGTAKQDSSVAYNEAGLLTPAMGEGMLQVLQDQTNEQALFRKLVRTSTPDTATTRPAMSHSLNRSTASHEAGVEGVLSQHVAQMEDVARATEGHIRDITGIRRDFTGLSPLQLHAETVSTMSAVLDRIDTPSTPTSTAIVTPAESPSTPTTESIHRGNPFDHDHDRYDGAHAIFKVSHALIEANKTVMSDCIALDEVIDHQSAFLTATSRQIKGLKNAVASYKEREEAEEHARRVIEDWERSQVERGLRGEKSTKEVLDELVLGFAGVVRECDARMSDLKVKSSERRAVPAV